MGDIADLYEEKAFQQEAEWEELMEELKVKAKDLKSQYKIGKVQWHAKDGSVVSVQKMTDSHVKNCLNFLNAKDEDSKTPVTKTWIKIFKLECKKRKI